VRLRQQADRAWKLAMGGRVVFFLSRYGLPVLILINVATSVLATVPDFDAAYGPLFEVIENISLAIFAAE